MRPKSFSSGWVGIVVLVFGIVGCGGSSGSTESGSESGPVADRFADLAGEDRETVVISAADPQRAFLISPAQFDTVIVRSSAVEGSEDAVVEALLKGSFPDGCTELHEMTQGRSGNTATVNLTMRRPEEAVCTQVVRPYRFFFRLDGRYATGSYELVLNDRSYPFEVE